MRGPLVLGAAVLVVVGVWLALFPPPVSLRTALPDEFNEVVEAESLASEQESVAGVRRALARQQQMYADLDARNASSFWPYAEPPALIPLFATLRSQELVFDDCAIEAADSMATAECRGWLRYITRTGSAQEHSDRHAWTIRLRRIADAWTISGIEAR